MKIIKTKIKDCYILEPHRYGDHRGYYESVTIAQLKELGFKDIVQVSHSRNLKGVIRGLHFQKNPYSQAKCVSCIQGAVLDVAVDLRKKSATYGQWVSVVLTPENGRMLYIPRGFAHGFLSLKDDTLFEYYIDNLYNPSSESGIIWNDPDINVNWEFEKYGIDSPIFSDKDQKYEMLKNSPSYFDEVI